MLKIISNVSFIEAPTETDELGDVLLVVQPLPLYYFRLKFHKKKIIRKKLNALLHIWLQVQDIVYRCLAP